MMHPQCWRLAPGPPAKSGPVTETLKQTKCRLKSGKSDNMRQLRQVHDVHLFCWRNWVSAVPACITTDCQPTMQANAQLWLLAYKTSSSQGRNPLNKNSTQPQRQGDSHQGQGQVYTNITSTTEVVNLGDKMVEFERCPLFISLSSGVDY